MRITPTQSSPTIALGLLKSFTYGAVGWPHALIRGWEDLFDCDYGEPRSRYFKAMDNLSQTTQLNGPTMVFGALLCSPVTVPVTVAAACVNTLAETDIAQSYRAGFASSVMAFVRSGHAVFSDNREIKMPRLENWADHPLERTNGIAYALGLISPPLITATLVSLGAVGAVKAFNTAGANPQTIAPKVASSASAPLLLK